MSGLKTLKGGRRTVKFGQETAGVGALILDWNGRFLLEARRSDTPELIAINVRGNRGDKSGKGKDEG